jgi:hypothetical protein
MMEDRMGKLSLEYIAGAMDCDGSFSISISENRYKSTTGKATTSPQVSFVVNLRQVPQYRYMLELVQKSLQMGRLYDHKAYSSTSSAMCSWQTTGQEETLALCKLLRPYLVIKQKEADLLIEAIELWIATRGEPRGAGFTHPLWVKDKIRDIASRMNPSQQKETSRRNKTLRKPILPAPDWALMENNF